MVRPGDWVRVTGGWHRGLTGRVTAGPTTEGVVYVRVRLTPSRHALLVVRVEHVVCLGSRDAQDGAAPHE